ncbi:MAG: DsbA family protein [Vicinamibacterales bacterium]
MADHRRPESEAEPADRVARLTVAVTERDHAQGPGDASVTLVEYGDFECPHCGRAHPVIQEIQRRLGEQLRFVFRHFPLGEMHRHAQHAAEASEAASSQGHFWEMHDALFEHQQALGDRQLAEYAGQIGIDESRLQRELIDHVHASRVRQDFMSGIRSGVNGTPTFFINGVRHDDPWDLDTLLAVLTAAAGGRPRTDA